LFSGLWALECGKWCLTTLLLTLATATRANGLLNAAFIPAVFLRLRWTPFRGLLCLAMMVLIISPFILVQAVAYAQFCPKEPWCTDAIPSVYAYVQKHVWHNGLFAYWKLKQIPNFCLALPVLVVSWRGGFHWLMEMRRQSVSKIVYDKRSPYMIQLTALATLAFFCFNVQISTRFLSCSCPALMWMLARENPALVTWYCVGYILVGSLMHSNFLPWT